MELLVNITVPGIDAAIADHLIMLFWDMLDEAANELHGRDGFFYILFIFMAVVMEGDRVAIIFVNPGSSDDGAPKVASNVFHDGVGITFVGLGIHIEAFFVFLVTKGFYIFKSRADPFFHFVEEGSAEGKPEEGVVKIIDIAPKSVVTVTAFGNEAVDTMTSFT